MSDTGILAVAADKVIDNDRYSFIFLKNAGVPYPKMVDQFGHWGFITLRSAEQNEITFTNDDSIKRWDVTIFASDQKEPVLQGNANECDDEAGLAGIIREMPKCNLLIEASLIERFQKACKLAGVALEIFKFDGTLATS